MILDIIIAAALVLLGLGVACGEMLAAWFSSGTTNMERDIPPMTIVPEEPTSPVLVSEAEFRVPAFVPGVEDHEYTEPLRKWQPEHSGRTYVSRSHNGTDLLA